jgi:hypothetical protein
MRKFNITVMHPGGTTYDFIVNAVRYYYDHNVIVFIKEDEKIEVYPQSLTIVIEQ